MLAIFDISGLSKATFTPDARLTPAHSRPNFMAWSGIIGYKITRSD